MVPVVAHTIDGSFNGTIVPFVDRRVQEQTCLDQFGHLILLWRSYSSLVADDQLHDDNFAYFGDLLLHRLKSMHAELLGASRRIRFDWLRGGRHENRQQQTSEDCFVHEIDFAGSMGFEDMDSSTSFVSLSSSMGLPSLQERGLPFVVTAR